VRPVRVPMSVRVAAAVVLAGALAGIAVAARETGPRIRHTAAGTAAARLAVATASDLAAVGTGWTQMPPVRSADPSFDCVGFHPDESAFVETGTAESRFTHAGGLSVDTASTVLQTAAMVRADTKLVVHAPGFVPCLKQVVTRALGATTGTVSGLRVGKLALRAYGDSVDAYRVTMTVTASNGQAIPVVFDVVLVTRGRTEIGVFTGAPRYAGIADALLALDANLASRLTARARP
jgi:hypothetical protein